MDDREWRQDVVLQLRSLASTNAQTAVVLERLSNQVADINEWRKEQRQEQRGAPERQALMSATVAQWAIAAIAVAALLLSLVGHVYLR